MRNTAIWGWSRKRETKGIAARCWAGLLLQSNVPVALVERTEVPLQLSTTVTTGVEGVDLGAAMPEPASLVQPFTVAVTV